MTRPDFDLLVVGGGSAGFAAAIRGVELGARVGLLEGGTLGGTCVNVGCVPSKTLIRAAEALHRRTHHGFAGIPASDGKPDWTAVRAQKDELVEELRTAKYWDVLHSYAGIDLIEQRATLETGGTVRLADGTNVSAGKVILTTGASPWVAPIPGLAASPYLDSAGATALEQLPASMIVIGGSAVGLELAQMFARLGVEVTVLEALPTVVPMEDPTVGTALAKYLVAEGLRIETNVRIERVESTAKRHAVHYHRGSTSGSVVAEQVLVATGRRPNTHGLGLEKVGITVGHKSEIVVNEYLRTANPNAYAAGDVIGDPMFVYVAAYGGGIAAGNALTGDQVRYDLTALPRVTFTDPAVAAVGLMEPEARAKGIDPLVSRLPLDQVPRALAARDTRGFVQLIADKDSRRLIGAQILAPEAGELITEAAVAIRFGLTIEDLRATFHPYLTLGEGIKLAAMAFDKDLAKLSCCAA
ncbi:MAG: mercury(II) reductase [Gemmatimonadales bacterium]